MLRSATIGLMVFFLSLETVAALRAPDPAYALAHYVHDHWDIDDGLPQNTVMTVVQDPAGYLWMGTFEGLARFDGQAFTRLLPEKFPALRLSTNELMIEADGTLWVGSESEGLFRIDPSGTIRHYAAAHGLASNVVLAIYRDRYARLWVGLDLGLCVLIDARFECLSADDGIPQEPVTSIIDGADGALWVATEKSGIYRLDGSEITRHHLVNGQPMGRVEDLSVGPDGRLWAAGFGAGLMAFDGAGWQVWGGEEGLSDLLVARVLADPLGSVWIGTYGAGLHRLSNGRIESLNPEPDLPTSHIQSLWLDREGSLWFGTSGGLSRLRSAAFVTISVRDGLNGPFVRAVAEDRAGTIWAGIDGQGLNHIVDGRVSGALRAPALLSDSIRAFGPGRDGGMWVGAYNGGVSHFGADGAVRHFRRQEGLAGPLIRAVIEDSRGVAWVGSDRNGITRISADGELTAMSIGPGLHDNDIRAIAEAPDGSVWFGTYGSGLARYQDGDLESLDVLGDKTVFAIVFEPRGGAWIGAQDGLFYLTADQNVRDVGVQAGVQSAVFQIIDDGHDHIWLCTNRGIMRLHLDSLLSGQDGQPRLFSDAYQGLESRQCNGASQPAGWKSRDGNLWFPTAAGVVRVDPRRPLSGSPPPKVVFQRVLAGDQELAIPVADQALTLQPDTRRVQFDYVSLTFIASDRLQYRYRLDDHDEDWIDAGNRRSAFYNDLAPGAYQFRVLAANADGVWNESEAVLRFEQLPNWYQTLWFRFAATALFIFMLSALVRLRLRHLRQRNLALESTVRNRTESLLSSHQELERTLRELKTTQTELVEARKLAALGSLVSGVAHEVNTPVGNSLTLASHLRGSFPDVDAEADPGALHRKLSKIKDGLALIETNLKHAGYVVSNFKRIDVSGQKTVRRRFRLQDVLSPLRLGIVECRNRGHALHIDCPPELEVDSYPQAIAESMSLLIGNSLEHAFLAPGGVIEVRARRVGDHVEIDYRDNGVGIPSDLRDHIFEPFFTANRGTHIGLGMTVLYNLVHSLLGGTIECRDAAGAWFRVIIPVHAPAASAALGKGAHHS